MLLPSLSSAETSAALHLSAALSPAPTWGRANGSYGGGHGTARLGTPRWKAGLEAVDLDSLAIKTEALLLVRQEVLDILALVALELDHLAHLRVCDDGAIAGELLLDHFEDLLLVEFLGEALHRR